MSYYPTERRGGCMESISGCCRQAYVYPLDTRKLLYAAGGVVGVILVAVVWSGLSSSGSDAAFKGSSVLSETPLIVGSNFFLSNLRDLVHYQVSKISFDQENSVFGNTSCSSCQTDLPRLKSGLVSSQIWSIDVPCDAMYKDAVTLTLEQLDAMSRLVNTYSTYLSTTTSSSEVTNNFKNGIISSVLAVTGGHSIDGRLAVLRVLKTLGVRVMALASNCSTGWSSYYNNETDNGLSTFGKKVVKEMNRLGIVIDLSESSISTQVDVLNNTSTPVVFTRGAAAALYNSSRNIQDSILDLLKNNDGVVMVTFAQDFLNSNTSNSTIDSVIAHINYIKNRIGANAVGIGGEFDASNETFPTDLSDVSKFPTLFDKLGETWSESDLKKLAGENLLRVLKAVEEYAVKVSSEAVDETYQLEKNSSCYSDLASRLDDTTNSSSTSTSSSTTVTKATITAQVSRTTTTQATTASSTTTAKTTTTNQTST